VVLQSPGKVLPHATSMEAVGRRSTLHVLHVTTGGHGEDPALARQ
jgi:hypothetical protein